MKRGKGLILYRAGRKESRIWMYVYRDGNEREKRGMENQGGLCWKGKRRHEKKNWPHISIIEPPCIKAEGGERKWTANWIGNRVKTQTGGREAGKYVPTRNWPLVRPPVYVCLFVFFMGAEISGLFYFCLFIYSFLRCFLYRTEKNKCKMIRENWFDGWKIWCPILLLLQDNIMKNF